MFNKLKEVIAKMRLEYRRYRLQSLLIDLVYDTTHTETGYILLLAYSTGWVDENACDYPFVMADLSIGSDESYESIFADLISFRNKKVEQGKRQGFITHVFDGEGDLYYIACPTKLNWDDKNLTVMECLAWLPGENCIKSESFMKMMNNHFPTFWRILST
jgi:hypothetical protein